MLGEKCAFSQQYRSEIMKIEKIKEKVEVKDFQINDDYLCKFYWDNYQMMHQYDCDYNTCVEEAYGGVAY